MSVQQVPLAQRTALESKFFADNIPVDRSKVSPEDQQGFDSVNDATIITLTGALGDAEITLNYEDNVLFFHVGGSRWQTISALISFRRDSEEDDPYLTIERVAFSDTAPPGLAATMLWRMARACAALGIPRIELYAVGGRGCDDEAPGGGRLSGYYAWPRLGFDGSVESSGHVEKADDLALYKQFPFFPAGLADRAVTTLHNLFETPGGKEFWLVAGRERRLTFTVAPSSRSVLRLGSYLTEKRFFL
ncbi:hypothetical protein [Burkholderia cepacia]|uniref:hypothetical protein n=1 Tax=Burkholderia cepacia TaxID=292 RepID=UPI0039A5343B